MSRPYRSHKVPACDFCRQRKARCTVDAIGQACLVCRLNGRTCSRAGIPQTSLSSLRSSSHLEDGRASADSRNRAQFAQPSPLLSLNPGQEATPEQSTHIIGPVVAGDARVLAEQYSQHGTSTDLFRARLRPSPYNIYSDDPSQPVLYLNVPKGRAGLSQKAPHNFRQTEVLEKIIEPYKGALLRLFAEKFHPYFPLLDDEYLASEHDLKRLPEVVVADLYAASIVFWKSSPALAQLPRPDVGYIWNLAIAALNEQSLAPDLSSALAATLDLSGRPVFSITGNALLIGRTVALCHSLGLNRDPSNWQIAHSEKRLRIRMWWAILIHDTWASITHGTPPHINADQHDVPLPHLEILLPQDPSDFRKRAATCFIAMCQLTEIVGTLLPLIYSLRKQKEALIADIHESERRLDDWLQGLPEYMEVVNFRHSTPGLDLRSLQLSYLAIRVLIGRLKLHDAGSSDATSSHREHYQEECRAAAHEITEFVEGLTANDCAEYWLAYSGYHFTSATTLLLRCAIEARDEATSQACVESANRLVTCLKRLKTRHGWDLADVCLAQCESIAVKMKAGDFRRVNKDAERQQVDSHDTSNEMLFSNDVFGFNTEIHFPDIWDMIDVDVNSYT